MVQSNGQKSYVELDQTIEHNVHGIDLVIDLLILGIFTPISHNFCILTSIMNLEMTVFVNHHNHSPNKTILQSDQTANNKKTVEPWGSVLSYERL